MVRVSILMNVSIRQAVQVTIIHIVLIHRAVMNVDVAMVIQWEV
jgi:hypothetical protein